MKKSSTLQGFQNDIFKDLSLSNQVYSRANGCDFRSSPLLARWTCITISHNCESSVSCLPRLIHESLIWNGLGRSMLGKTFRSIIARLLSFRRANSVMNFRSCWTGSTIQRCYSFFTLAFSDMDTNSFEIS